MPALALLLIDDRHGRWAAADSRGLAARLAAGGQLYQRIWAEGDPQGRVLLVTAGSRGREYLRFADLDEAFAALDQPLGARVSEILPVYHSAAALELLAPPPESGTCAACDTRPAAVQTVAGDWCSACTRMRLLRRKASPSS